MPFFFQYKGDVALKTVRPFLCVPVSFVILEVNSRCNVKTKPEDGP